MLRGVTSTYPKATKVLERYRRYVVSQAKANLTRKGVTSSTLKSSIKGYVEKKFNRGVGGRFTGGTSLPSLRFEMNSYGQFVDTGVKGTDPVDSRHTGGRSLFGSAGRFKKRKKSIKVKGNSALAKWAESRGLNKWAVAKSVHKKGISRSLFFSKPFLKKYTSTLHAYHSAVADDMSNNIANQIANAIKKKNRK